MAATVDFNNIRNLTLYSATGGTLSVVYQAKGGRESGPIDFVVDADTVTVFADIHDALDWSAVDDTRRADLNLLDSWRSLRVTAAPSDLWINWSYGVAHPLSEYGDRARVGDVLGPFELAAADAATGTGEFVATKRMWDPTISGTANARFNNARSGGSGGMDAFTGGSQAEHMPMMFELAAGARIVWQNTYPGVGDSPDNVVYHPELAVGNSTTVSKAIHVFSIGVNGVVSSATTTVITIASGLIDSGQFGTGKAAILFTSGAQIGRWGIITSNTATTITIQAALAAAPSAGDQFTICAVHAIWINSSRSGTMESGAKMWSDPLPYPVPKTDWNFVVNDFSCAAGDKVGAIARFRNQTTAGIAAYDLSLYDHSSLVANGGGASLIDAGVIGASTDPASVSSHHGGGGAGFLFGPAAIIGRPTRKTKPFIVFVTDSKGCDYFNLGQMGHDTCRRTHGGLFGYGALSGDHWFCVLNRSAMRASDHVNGRSELWQYIPTLADYVFIELAINDLVSGGKTAQELVNRLQRITAPLLAMGIKCGGTTLPPYASSTLATRVGYKAAATQTDGTAGVVQAVADVNNWMRGLPQLAISTPLADVFNTPPIDIAAWIAHPSASNKYGPGDNVILGTGVVASASSIYNFTTTAPMGPPSRDAWMSCLIAPRDGAQAGKYWSVREVNGTSVVGGQVAGSVDPTANLVAGVTVDIIDVWGIDGIHWTHSFIRYGAARLDTHLDGLEVVRP